MDARTVKLKMLLAAVALFAIGCNADPGARREIALLRAEIQDLEDSYYRLKSQQGDDTANRSVGPGEPEISWDENYNGELIEYPATSGDIILENDVPPSLSPQFNEPQSSPNRQPSINPGNSAEEIDILPPAGNGQSSLNRNSPQTRSASGANRQAQNKTAVSNAERPADLILMADQTIAMDSDGDGQPDGIQATFALRNQAGKNVIEPSKLVFSLLDPALPIGKQRIGFWEHSTTGGSPVLEPEHQQSPEQVFLPWQAGPPANAGLILFVRHTRNDGTALETSVAVSLDAPDGLVADNRTNQGGRSGGNAPEILIDTQMPDEQNTKAENRRPLWRATR